MLDRQTNKSFGGVSEPPIQTSFAEQRKEASFSVEEASTLGSYSYSRSSRHQLASSMGSSIYEDVHTF